MKKDPLQRERARDLRKEMSPAETILWSKLRGRRFAGFRFRRQQPIGAYIVDFVCQQAMVIIEADGESHLDRRNEDRQRDEFLESLGYRILRFTNVEVFDEVEPVLDRVWLTLTERIAEAT